MTSKDYLKGTDIKDSAINEWVIKTLSKNGFLPLHSSSIDNVQTTAWSSVKRILTSKGDVYLKQMPKLLSLEAIIIKKLHDEFKASVPIVIDMNQDLHCFLMLDAGKPFYHFKNHPKRLLWIKDAIKQYKDIQYNSLSRVDEFLSLGVPDWRLQQLPLHFEALIHQENTLLEDGLSQSDLKKLLTLLPECQLLCEALSLFPVQETLDHCDLHGANVLIDEKTETSTLIDWGETVITHPYFSLLSLLENLIQYYAFEEKDLWASFFENQHPLDNHLKQKNQEKIIALVKKLLPVYSALAFHQLFIASDKDKFLSTPKCKGRITKYLKEFMSLIQN